VSSSARPILTGTGTMAMILKTNNHTSTRCNKEIKDNNKYQNATKNQPPPTSVLKTTTTTTTTTGTK
jgi:hypothetical protein